jgi:carboxymethylenebutenolidase
MIKLFCTTIALSWSVFVFWLSPKAPKATALPAIVMCHSEVVEMKNFALDADFQALHPSPQALVNQTLIGEMTTLSTPDGKTANAYMIKAKRRSKKWLFVYQEWWGLNEHIKKQADVFYKDLSESVNVIALDMYDGKATSDPKEAGKFMSESKEERLENIVKGAINLAGKKAKIANVGWCFGGTWSLKSALLGGKQSVGSVIYYGMPVRDVAKLKTLHCDVLGIFATEKYISKDIIEEFAGNMKTADKKLDYSIFDAVHGFSNPSNPKYDETKSKEAYAKAIVYLKTRLKV